MTPTLTWLTAVTLLTACLWIPYILNRLAVGPGLLHEVGYPDTPTVLSPWAARLKKAHENAVQNLVVFAPLVLMAHVAGAANETTATAALVYLVARAFHAAAYTFAIPWARTISFSVGWAAQLTVGLQLLGVNG